MLSQAIRLHMNEMPYPPPQHVVAAARRALARLNRYADAEDLALLRRLLGEYAGVPNQRVIVGPGSDVLLREMIHAFAGERKVVMPSPSFLPTAEAAREAARWWVGLRLSPPTFALQPELLLAEAREPCLIIIDNPNNPTGQMMVDRRTLQALLENEDALVVIDEAYYEFARMSPSEHGTTVGSFVELVDDYANLAVTRTMDKAFGLAGARVGYAVVGEVFRRVFASFYPLLPQSSLCGALEALQRPAYAQENVRRLIEERERLRGALQDRGALVHSSHTNFLLVRTRLPDLAARLSERGVLVSDVSNQLPPGFIRVSVGTAQENDAFLAAFEQVGGGQMTATRGGPTP